MKGLNVTDPGAMIVLLVSLLVFANIASSIFPKIISAFATLAGIGNFTFESVFSDDGIGEIVLSAIVLIAILVALGIKMKGTRQR